MQTLTFQGLEAPSKTLSTVIGADVGNVNTKIAGNGWRDRQSSYVVEDLARKSQGYLGSFEYIEGDRRDLINRAFLTGDNAREVSPGKGQNVYQDDRGKVSLSLQMLLGCLSHRAHVDRADISLVFSTANANDIQAQTAALEGMHQVSVQGRVSTFRVKVLKGFPEGYGALASQGLASGTNICLDLGGGDIAVKVFGLKGSLIASETFAGGASELIQTISENAVFKGYRHGGDRDLIRQALEAGHFLYGSTGISFEDAYKEAIGPWSKIALRPAMHFATPYRDRASQYIAIGGGALLPGMASALSGAGITIANDPVFASASGMYLLGAAKSAS